MEAKDSVEVPPPARLHPSEESRRLSRETMQRKALNRRRIRELIFQASDEICKSTTMPAEEKAVRLAMLDMMMSSKRNQRCEAVDQLAKIYGLFKQPSKTPPNGKPHRPLIIDDGEDEKGVGT